MPLNLGMTAFAKRQFPKGSKVRRLAAEAEFAVARLASTAMSIAPEVVSARPRRLFVSLTSDCNLRCGACKYGRDFVPGHELPWSLGEPMLEDAAAIGIRDVRLYGGEPLLHRDVDKYVSRSVELGMSPWLTTNGLLLAKKIDRLWGVGLRRISLGLYGLGGDYDAYVQRRGAYAVVENALERVRARHGPGELSLKLDWLLMRDTCDEAIIERTLALADRFAMAIHVNLIHYSLPYFVGPDENSLHHFRPEDRPRLERIVDKLLEAKAKRPDLVSNTEIGLRSIPDWLLLGPAMRVPCIERNLLWVGPDGTVQMCYVTFKLGDLRESRLRDITMTDAHHRAARAAFALDCPNCHCSYGRRTNSHAPSRRAYSAP